MIAMLPTGYKIIKIYNDTKPVIFRKGRIFFLKKEYWFFVLILHAQHFLGFCLLPKGKKNT